MYQVFYEEGSILILNDETENTRLLSREEEIILFRENELLRKLQDKKTFRVFIDNIYGINNLP